MGSGKSIARRLGRSGQWPVGTGRSATVPPAPSRPRVLLLEEDERVSQAMRWVLAARGAVTVVRTAQAALEQLGRHETWNAFVLDIDFPDGAGLDVLRRAREEHADAVALAISGLVRREDINVVVRAGAHFLAKPFSRGDLLRFLDRHLQVLVPTLEVAAGQDRDEAGMYAVDRHLPDELRQLADDALGAEARLANAESGHAYSLALLARAASARELDVASTLEACARAARVSRQTLQDYVTLTTRGGTAKVAALIGMRDLSGKTLTKRQLLRIAPRPERDSRGLRRRGRERGSRPRRDLPDAAAGTRRWLLRVQRARSHLAKERRNDVSDPLCQRAGNLMSLGCRARRPKPTVACLSLTSR